MKYFLVILSGHFIIVYILSHKGNTRNIVIYIKLAFAFLNKYKLQWYMVCEKLIDLVHHQVQI